MTEVCNVAVFPCGSEVGLEVSRSLKYSPHFKLFGWNSVADYGRIEFQNYVGDIPFYTADAFIDKIQKYVSEFDIDFLIPGMDEVGVVLKANEHQLDCEVVWSDANTAIVLRRKSSTYEKLHTLVDTPVVFENYDDAAIALPVFAKPDIGYGSKGAKKLVTIPDLDAAWDNKELIVTEYLPGAEYTVDCFSNTDHQVLFAEARKRERIKMGISVSSAYSAINQATEWAQVIASELHLQGAWFFQVKQKADGEIKLLEVGSRVAGSMSMYRSLGVNFIMLDLYQRTGKSVSILPADYSQVSLERALDCKVKLELDFKTVYVDLDDCLVINGAVNTSLVSFLYKCLNHGHKLVLLTRHDGDVDDYLKKFRLTHLFDQVVHITDRSKLKSAWVSDKSAIFIDDSFSERKDVHESTGVPVFAPDAIDLLS